MGRKLKHHDAETAEGPHQDEKTSPREKETAGDSRSGGLWTRETKISLVIMSLLLSGLGAAVYFRLSPESIGDDPFAMLRNDPPREAEPAESPPNEPAEQTPPPSAVVVSESTPLPEANVPAAAEKYGAPPSYQQPDTWQPTVATGEPVAGADSSFGQQAGSLVDQTAGEIVDQAQQAADGFHQQANSLVQQATDSLSQQVGQTSDATMGQFQQAADAVRDPVGTLTQQATEALTPDTQQGLATMATEARQAVGGFADRAEQAVDAFTQQAPAAVDSVVGQVGEVLENQMQKAKGFTQQAADSVRDTLENAGREATPFPADRATAAQSPFSAFEPAPAVSTPANEQPRGDAQRSNSGGMHTPRVTIAEPPSRLNSTAPRPDLAIAPAAPMESRTVPPNDGQPRTQPLSSVPSRRRSSDSFSRAPERFDVSAFEPPAATQPLNSTPPQSPSLPATTTAPVPATAFPATLPPDTNQSPAATTGTGNFNRAEATYTVQPNDNYWLISKKLYGTGAYFKALFEHNRDRFPRANRLRVGDVIRTPPMEVLQQTYPKLSPRATGTSSPVGASRRGSPISRGPLDGGRSYLVQEGDTLYDIARYELGDANRWHEIRQLNRDVLGNDADRLRSGIELRLPATTATGIVSRPQPTITR